MDDLSATSGLPLWLDAQRCCLVLDQPRAILKAEPQPLRLMQSVLLDPEAEAPAVPYWTYLRVALPTDEGVFEEFGVRHNLVLLQAGRIGPEYVKTWGHSALCGEGVLCPEVYAVLHGRALFLLQRSEEGPWERESRRRVVDVRWIEARAAQKVVVPAGYGLVIANLGVDPLVVSSLVAETAWPVHVAFEAMHGAAYYVTERDGEMAVEPNRHYAEPLPPMREDTPLRAPELGIEEDVPLYSAFVHQPERFAWLLEGAPAVAEES